MFNNVPIVSLMLTEAQTISHFTRWLDDANAAGHYRPDWRDGQLPNPIRATTGFGLWATK
jgi:hypothetical protein